MKNEIFKKYLKDGRPNCVYESLQTITWDLTEAISSSNYVNYERLANKLNDSNTSSKAYWSIITTLVNGKKVPVIPLILVNNKLVTNFKEKANIFNGFFSKKCRPIPNNSTLPSIQRLNSNKAHGHDGISIRMLKLYGPSVIKPLSLLFNNCLRDGG